MERWGEAFVRWPRRKRWTVGPYREWYLADITDFDQPHRWKLWHGPAVFHFLVEEVDRRAYLGILERAVEPGGPGGQGGTRSSLHLHRTGRHDAADSRCSVTGRNNWRVCSVANGS